MRDFGSLADSKQPAKAEPYVPRTFNRTESANKPAETGASPSAAPADSRFSFLKNSPAPSSSNYSFNRSEGFKGRDAGASGEASGGRDFGAVKEGGSRDFGSFRDAPRDFPGSREGGSRDFPGSREGGSRDFPGSREGGSRDFPGSREGGSRSFGGFRDSKPPREFGSSGSTSEISSRFSNLKTAESAPAPFGRDRGFGPKSSGGFDKPRPGGYTSSYGGPREVQDVSSLYSKSITDIVNTQASAKTVPDERARLEAEKKDETESREALIASNKKIFEVAGMGTALATFRSNISKILDHYISDSSLNAHITAVKEVDKLTLVNRPLMIVEAVKHIVETALNFESKGHRLSAGFLISALRGPVGTGKNAEAPLSDENLATALESLSKHQLALLEVDSKNTESAARLSEIINEILTSTVTMEKKKKISPVEKSVLKEKTLELFNKNLLTEVARKLKEAEEEMMREAEELIRKAEEERLAKLEEEKAAKAAARAFEERRMGGVKTDAEIAADELIDSGLVGEELAEKVTEKILPFRADGARALMKAIVKKAHHDGKINNKCSWLTESQYGSALSAICYGRSRASVAALFGLQECFSEFGFPVGDKGNPILDRVFRVLYDSDIMEEEPMMIWRNDTRDPTPGKDKALMDTDVFLTQLEQAEEESDDEDEDGDD